MIHGPRAAIKTATPFCSEKTCTGKKALQGPIDYITGEKLWEEDKWPGFWSGLRFSYLTLRRRQRIESKKSIICELLRRYL